MADGVSTLDPLSFGTSTGGAAGAAETTLTVGQDRQDDRSPPDLKHVWAAQLNAIKNLALKISQDLKGGTRLGTRTQSSNPFGAGESGFYIDTAGVGYTVFNGTRTVIGPAGATGNWTFTANDGDRSTSGPLTIGAGGNMTSLGVGSANLGTLTLTAARLLMSQRALTTGTQQSALALTGGAHTGLTASTEQFDVNFSLARTVQFATGALTTQRAAVFQAPTYAFVGASVVTTAATLAVTGAPVAGTNATITNPYALWLQAGNLGMAAGGSIISAGTLNRSSQVADGGAAVAHSNDTTTALATDGATLARWRSGAADWFTITRSSSARKFTFFGDADSAGNGPVLIKSTASSAGLTMDASTAGGRIHQMYSTSAGLFALADLTAALNRWQMDSSGHWSPFADATYDLGIDGTNRVRKLAVTQINERAASAQTAALLASRDSANSARFGIDSSGLPSLGSRFEFRELWLWTATAAGASTTLAASSTNAVINSNNTWSYTSTVNATGFTNLTGFATGTPINSGITIGSGTAAGNSTFFKQTTPFIIFNVTNTVIVAEWQMALSAVGANSVTVAAGITNNGVNAGHPGGYYFQKASTDTNWQCMTDTGAVGPTASTSGVPPVAGTAQMFRIEVYGSGTPVGATTAKFYIDSTLVTTTTTNIFTGGSMIFSAYNTATGAVAQRNLSFGPLLLMFNQVPAALIP